MTGALFSDIPMGNLAPGIASQSGSILPSDGMGDTFKGILGSILSSSAAAQQTVFTGDPVAADTADDTQDMSLLSSKVVTEAKLSPSTERALKYLSGSLLEDVMGKPDGYFTKNFFDLFKLKTQTDLNIGSEKKDEDEAGGITDLWTTLLDSLNGTEVTEMSMFSANLGDALFGSKRDYSKPAGSVLSDLFDGLSTRNKTDMLKASGTDLADIAAMALMASGNIADIAGLVNQPNADDSDMSEADRELFALIEAADSEAVEYVSEKLGELVEQAQSRLAEDIPEPAENKTGTETVAYAAADMSPVIPAAENTEAAEQAEQVDKAPTPIDPAATDNTLQYEETAAVTVNAPVTETVTVDEPKTETSAAYTETAVTAEAAAPAVSDTTDENTAKPKKDSLSEIAANFGMRSVSVKQNVPSEANAAVIPDTGLKDLYLSMRNFAKTSRNDIETPFVFETNTAVPAENTEKFEEVQPVMTSEEVQTEDAPRVVSETAETLSEKENTSGLDGNREDSIAPEFVAAADKTLPANEADIPAETEKSVPEDRYNTVEQLLAKIEENSFSGSGTRELVVKLTPETLGEITVRIAKDVTGAVEITLAAQNRDVSELISSRASELAQSLSDKGTAVSSVNVVDPAQAGQNMAFDMSGGQNAFNFRQQDLRFNFDGNRRFSAEDDDADGTVEAVSAADSIDSNIFVSKEAILWQKI